MGYDGRNYWSAAQKASSGWFSSGWKSSGTGKAGAGKHVAPWKCAGNDGCGYAWNKPQHKYCNKCSQHWDFGQRLANGKPAAAAGAIGAGTKTTAPVVGGPATPSPTDDHTDPAFVASERDALCLKLRRELLSISSVLGTDHVDVVSRTAQLDILVKEQNDAKPCVPVNILLQRNLTKQNKNQGKRKKNDNRLDWALTKLEAAQKEHDDAVSSKADLDKEFVELEAEKAEILRANPVGTDPNRTNDEVLEGGLDDDWEDMFNDVSDEPDQLSGDAIEQFEKFKKLRSELRKLCKSVTDNRSQRMAPQEQAPTPTQGGATEAPTGAACSSLVLAVGAASAGAKPETSTRSAESGQGGEASRRKLG